MTRGRAVGGIIAVAVLAAPCSPAFADMRPRLRPAPEVLAPVRTTRPRTRASGPAPAPAPVEAAAALAETRPQTRPAPDADAVPDAKGAGSDAVALGPPQSPRPRDRDAAAPAPSSTIFRSLRPRDRPALPGPGPVPAASAVANGAAQPVPPAVGAARPGRRVVLDAIFGPKAGRPRAVAGSVCGDPSIKGTAMPPIAGEHEGCGIREPVRVTEVAGVALMPPATIDCAASHALDDWITRALKPAFRGDRVTGLRVYASYACRGRNNVKGAKISEHAKGNAIDIGEVVTARRGTLTVEHDFNSARGTALRTAYKGACGIFGTTLGPGSDGYHENHMHFDVARYRSGSYCR